MFRWLRARIDALIEGLSVVFLGAVAALSPAFGIVLCLVLAGVLMALRAEIENKKPVFLSRFHAHDHFDAEHSKPLPMSAVRVTPL